MGKRLLPESKIQALYRKRARFYDVTVNLYYLLGFRKFHYRRQAVAALGLRPGDTVVELGCGTGLNLAYLAQAVAPHGRVVGVDFSPHMLAVAQKRTRRLRSRFGPQWPTVELVEAPAQDYAYPPGVNGVLSTFALTLMEGHDQIIGQAAQALAPGGKMVVLDLKWPANWLAPLVPLGLMLVRPFGNSQASTRRKPWQVMARHLPQVELRPLYFDVPYLAIGQREEETQPNGS